MNAKPKTPPKKKAVRNAPSKKKVATKSKHKTVHKVPAKVAESKSSKTVSSVSTKKKTVSKKTMGNAPSRQAVNKKAAPKRKVVKKKLRARQVRLGPIPKYHTDHKSWDKEAVMAVICERTISSSNGLATICKKDNDLPTVKTVFQWMSEEINGGGAKPLSDNYARAKESQADYIADEMFEIADDGTNDYMTDLEGNERTNQENIQRSRLRIDTRKWVASKLKPKKYGDKLELSGDPERPLSSMTDTELDAQIAALTKMLAEVKLA